VVSTITALRLCTEHHPKAFLFVSSTAVLEAEHYVKQSDMIIQHGGKGLPETDDLEGSRTTLTTGYGQSKWVCEKLIMEAGKRGLAGWTIRPSYVVGDSVSAGKSA
jgi:L-aminoadipate-semialdehyde dehydrogenase